MIRVAAVKALGEIGSEEPVPHVVKLLGDKSGVVREKAAEALGEIGMASEEAVVALIKALNDRTVVPDRKRALENKILEPYVVAEAAAIALGKLGPPAIEAADALEKISHEQSLLGDAATEALASITGRA